MCWFMERDIKLKREALICSAAGWLLLDFAVLAVFKQSDSKCRGFLYT